MNPFNRLSFLLLSILLFMVAAQASTVEVISVPSPKMGKDIPVTLILPDAYKDSTQRWPVTYLLHGAGDNHAKWNKSTDIAELSDEYGMIFVCPDGNATSWYFDSPINPKSQYETFVAKECVQYIDTHYQTKADRASRAICGASMGGHGALFLSIRNKEVFSIAVALSGGVDIRPFPERWGIKRRIGSIETHPENWEQYTVINQAKTLNDQELAISIDCGDKDFFIHVNRALHQQLEADGIRHTYLEQPGKHGWIYWAQAIKRQLPFIDTHFKQATSNAPTPPAAATAAQDIPRVLIIGDSISIGYTPHVIQMLQGTADVVHHKGNAGPSISGMNHIDRWIGDTQWDVIHFNWGLWDMYGWQYMKQDRRPETYEKRLTQLVLRLKETGAKLIWANTTPICPEVEVNYRRLGGEGTITPAIEREYQDAAARVMETHGITINDLHACMLPHLETYALAPNNIHYSKAGYIKLAEQVAQMIEQSIAAE